MKDNYYFSEILQFYKKNNLNCDNLTEEKEHANYSAYNFMLAGKQVKFRIAKITPIKEGAFVALWKRDINKKTIPYDASDLFDLYIIHIKDEQRQGQFIFPKEILVKNGILSLNNKGGKRGFRLYPTWTTPSNKQAQKTQAWQIPYFYDFLDIGQRTFV